MSEYDLNQPEHLIVNQVIRRLEAYLAENGKACEFGAQGRAIIEDLVIEYGLLLTKGYDANGELSLKNQGLKKQIEHVIRLSDVGDLFDGHDELNEYTHEENEKHLIAALDRIQRIVTGKEEPE